MHNLREIASCFDFRADFVHAHIYGSGHINDTYCAWFDQAGQRLRYIIQRINHNDTNKIKRPAHNLDRCRNQFAYVAAQEKRMAELEDIVATF